MRWPLVGFVGALVLASAAASAAPAPGKRERVAVLVLTIAGDAPPELRTQMQKSLDGGLYAAGYEVVTHDEVMQRLKSARELEGCYSTTCLDRIGELITAKRFVNARIEASGASYSIELQLLGSDASGGLVQRLEKSCPVCTLSEANDLMSKTASELTGGTGAIDTKTAKVNVRSNPRGAQIVVDDTLAGTAPLQVKLRPGEHNFVASLPKGYRAAELRRAVMAGEQDLELTLEKIEIVSREVDQPHSRFGAWKWVVAAGALGALGGGIYLLAINDTETDCPAAGGTCMSRYDTLIPGAAVTAGGVGLGVLAIYMLTHDKAAPATPESDALLLPIPGGAQVVWAGTF